MGLEADCVAVSAKELEVVMKKLHSAAAYRVRCVASSKYQMASLYEFLPAQGARQNVRTREALPDHQTVRNQDNRQQTFALVKIQKRNRKYKRQSRRLYAENFFSRLYPQLKIKMSEIYI